MEFIKEQLWLKTKEDKRLGEETSYEDFIFPFFNDELAPVSFLKDFLIKSGAQSLKKVLRSAKLIEKEVLFLVKKRTKIDQKAFVIQALNEMSQKFLHEENEQEGRDQSLGHKGLRLYRTFDYLDEIFNLNYQLDRDMAIDHSATERLYEQSGVGVQSGYSTILLSLHSIEAKPNSKIIDLGSGYGRVGLVYALLRPDIDFTGYEYVPHRVDVSNSASESLGLQDSLNYLVQDLSLQSFKIPDADFYYLYDPFSKETYYYVLKQIVEVSKRRDVTVVTKGNARNWLVDISNENSWRAPVIIDNGNLCIFRSF